MGEVGNTGGKFGTKYHSFKQRNRFDIGANYFFPNRPVIHVGELKFEWIGNFKIPRFDDVRRSGIL